MTKYQIMWRLLYLSLFMISPYGYTENQLLPSAQESVQFEQKQRLESELIQRNRLEKQSTISIEDALPSPSQNEICFLISEIQFVGVTQLTTKTQTQLTSSYLKRCLTLSEIQKLTKHVTNYYMEQGFITSQAIIPEQDLSSHQLLLQVIEGHVETIEIENSPERLVHQIFPYQQGKILNLRHIEQGLEQLNRLSSAKYTIDIQPGSQNGYSRVIIHQQGKKWPITSQLNLDNSGMEATGKQLLTGGLTVDSPLGFGEQWSVSGNTDMDGSVSHHNRYIVANVNVPYGYWSYRYQFYRNSTLQPFYASGQQYRYEGKNTNQQLDISRLIYRDGKQRLTLQSSLKHKNANTQLASQTLSISSPTLTSLSFTPQYSTTLGQGYFTFNPAAEWGISAFGASPDTLAKDSPRSHYRKFSLSSSYQYFFSNGLTYLTSFYGQYSPDNLYGIERISIGGQYSVRGYHEQSLSGNRGGYWRNEINKDIANTAIGQLRFIGALDYGFIASDKYHVEHDTLAGGAVGLSFTGNSLIYSQFLLSKPLHYPSQLKPDNWSAYWSVSFSL
ncbi:ShlB/FhaC/HecB family hemolysin secretion/activation protein [Providencia huaxiensis]|uniref:ShlB/FhaC/HecB family hemolysin secretion/activation protein n=1 Tax=Providencia huaxiensis TaxID=2027290 RepID=UPI001B38EA86|nr:ShlB/FhaC/HecB family hemolysin secretion/activation protein [Providencia huaxiensis]MBQ0536089.1 ShlB/FhaC/HecB family hemolysin secretion/activation protein [Providencia huaxiensis]MBQ0589197.1 ShlB/FhaC/HecB family hemolysin secretion/activation protein [Providencia huaxiensis]MDI7240794.1 ShlB/FhaC/HecB family hemolysin secretion/activation protein [Providencia huaxiensis]